MLRLERSYDHPVERVWRALTDGEELRQWFPGELAGQPMGEAASLVAWPSVHERYAATWGIDPEIGRAAYEQQPAG